MTSLEDTSVIVDHQAHWYPRSCVEVLISRSDYPKTERSADDGSVLRLDEGVRQGRTG